MRSKGGFSTKEDDDENSVFINSFARVGGKRECCPALGALAILAADGAYLNSTQAQMKATEQFSSNGIQGSFKIGGENQR
jgi:hypothetical protein